MVSDLHVKIDQSRALAIRCRSLADQATSVRTIDQLMSAAEELDMEADRLQRTLDDAGDVPADQPPPTGDAEAG